MVHSASSIVLLCAALFLGSCVGQTGDRHDEGEIMSETKLDAASIRAALPIGTPAIAVTQWLHDRKVENSGYIVDERLISAALRDPSGDAVVSKTLLLTFRFDADDKLVLIESRDGLTGP